MSLQIVTLHVIMDMSLSSWSLHTNSWFSTKSLPSTLNHLSLKVSAVASTWDNIINILSTFCNMINLLVSRKNCQIQTSTQSVCLSNLTKESLFSFDSSNILCKADSSFFIFQPDAFSACFRALCKACRTHVPIWTSWLRYFSFLSSLRRSRNHRFTFQPSEETWSNLLSPIPDKHMHHRIQKHPLRKLYP